MSITAKKMAKVSICPQAFSISASGYSELETGAIVVDLDDYSIVFSFTESGDNRSDSSVGYRLMNLNNTKFRVFNKSTGEYRDFSRNAFLVSFGSLPYNNYQSALNIYHVDGNKFVIFIRKVESYYQTVYGCVGEIGEDLNITFGTVYTLANNVWNNFSISTTNKVGFGISKLGGIFLQPFTQYSGNSSSPTSISVSNSIVTYSVTGFAISTLQTRSMSANSPLTSNSTTNDDIGARNIIPISENEAHYFVREQVSPQNSIYKLTITDNALSVSTIMSPTNGYGNYYSGLWSILRQQPLWINGKSICGIAGSNSYSVYDKDTFNYELLSQYVGYNGTDTYGGSLSVIDNAVCGFYYGMAKIATDSGVVDLKQKLFKNYETGRCTNSNSPEYGNWSAHRCLYGFGNWLCCIDKKSTLNTDVINSCKEEIFFKAKFVDGYLCCDGYCEEKELVSGETGKVKQITSICVASKVHGDDTRIVIRDSSGELLACNLDEIPYGVLNFANHPIIIDSGDALKAEMVCGFGDVAITVYGIEEVTV